MLTFEQMQTYREQELAEALKWHAAMMGPKLTPEKIEAYKAGFQQGYGKAMAAAKLHGIKQAA